MAKRTTTPPPDARVRVRAITANDWPIIEQLFGENGACGGCWCMYWRVPRGGKLWDESKGEKNRRAFRKLVTAGNVHGCIAFHGNDPVGWCCVGPRGDFPRIERTKTLATDWDERTWSAPCFYIRSAWRGHGVATALLKEAVKLARKLGAKQLEAYPVEPKSVDKIPAAFAWTGVPRMFEACDFVQITPPDRSRHVFAREFC